MKDWQLTEESFNLFLSWLSLDRDTAGRKYEDIRHRVIFVLECRGCTDAEDAADEAINRFIRRLPELMETYKGDPYLYILVVARNIQHEREKKQPVPLPENVTELHANPVDEFEQLVQDCLDKCLGQLDTKNRDLLLDYYLNDKQEKIDFRKRLAKQLGIALNALRLRVHRLRNTVHACMDNCLGTDIPAEME